MKKFTTIFCLSILVAVFLFMFIFSVCLPRTTVSDNSYLKEWPEFSFESLFSGSYFKDITYYFTDTIHMRDKFIDKEATIRDLYGIENNEPQLHVIYEESDEPEDDPNSQTEDSSTVSGDAVDSSAIVESSDNTQSQESDTTSSTPDSTPDSSEENSDPIEEVNPEMSGSILIVGTRAIELYGGNAAGAERYAAILNEFASKVGDSVNVYSMVIPKPSAYYIEQAIGYEKYIYRNKNDIDTISQNLSDDVIDVNIYNILGQHADEDIYLRTDTHWSALGAYYGASVLAEKAGVAFPPLDEYTVTHREGYVGVMYKYSDYNPKILNNPEDFPVYYPDTDYEVFYYPRDSFENGPLNIDRDHDGVQDYNGFFWHISDEQRSSWYSTFIRGDNYAVKAVSNDCKNGRKLLIVKDSYGNALSPFLIEGFEEIYVVDGREYKDSVMDTIEKFGITDVLFAECTFSAVGRYLTFLEELCR